MSDSSDDYEMSDQGMRAADVTGRLMCFARRRDAPSFPGACSHLQAGLVALGSPAKKT